tara:strand:+ start:1521 stop:2075 length:555 start_codon:yes stop_codon:yes gene_type:complete
MARTPSKMVKLGTKAKDFNLLDVTTNDFRSLDKLKGKCGTVIMFICNHCPYVKHVNKTIVKLANKYIKREVNFIAISSNDIINYPEDSPELMKKNAVNNDFIFPYLYDEDQQVAKKYDAACTPDFYLYNSSLRLIYRGQLDDSRPGNGIICDGNDLDYAISCILEKKDNPRDQKPSIGCNIKWK